MRDILAQVGAIVAKATDIMKTASTSRSRLSSLLLTFSFAAIACTAIACGGSVETVGTGDGQGSSSGDTKTGGNGTSSGSKSSGNTSGNGPGTRCDGLPECQPGETQRASASECPQDVGCVKREVCGTAIWCSQDTDQCAGYPSCPTGYVETKGCIPDSECTTASMCGVTIICQKQE